MNDNWSVVLCVFAVCGMIFGVIFGMTECQKAVDIAEAGCKARVVKLSVLGGARSFVECAPGTKGRIEGDFFVCSCEEEEINPDCIVDAFPDGEHSCPHIDGEPGMFDDLPEEEQ